MQEERKRSCAHRLQKGRGTIRTTVVGIVAETRILSALARALRRKEEAGGRLTTVIINILTDRTASVIKATSTAGRIATRPERTDSAVGQRKTVRK